MSTWNAYENELFDFFAKEDNFKGMLLSVRQFGMVQARILVDFWAAVEKKLESRLPHSDGWVYILPQGSEVNSSNWKVRIYKEQWLNLGQETISIGWEAEDGRWYYGVIINRGLEGYQKIQETFFKSSEVWANKFVTGTSSEWYPLWRWVEIDLRNPEGLVTLLPDNRDDHVNAVVDQTVELCTLIAPSIQAALDSRSYS